MTLDQFRTQTLFWDKANKSIIEKIKAHQGDSNGRKLRVQVLNNGTVEDLSGVSLSLAWRSSGGDANGLDAFEIVDASKGIFEINYTRGMLANEGNLRASLVLIDSGRIESDSFTIEMMKTNVDDNSVQSENSFTALTRALVDVSKLEDNYAPRLNEVTAQLAHKADKTYAQEIESRLNNVIDGLDGTEEFYTPIGLEEYMTTQGQEWII